MLNYWAELWAHIKRAFVFRKTKPKKSSQFGVYTLDQFCALIEHERRRADRTGDRFSVVVFPMENSDSDLLTLCSFPDLLLQSVRSTDAVGWFKSNQIGVLLVGTPPSGAYRFLTKIRQSGRTLSSLPKCQVYVYPSDELSDKQGSSASASVSDMDRELVQFEALDIRSKTSANGAGRTRSTVPWTGNPEGKGKWKCTALGLEPHLGVKVSIGKRLFDITVCLTGLFLLFPFLILVAILIKIVSPGPVFFKQRRIGYLGRPFVLLKFRTMHVSAKRSRHEEYMRDLITHDVPMKKLDQHDEMIRHGKFLRNSGVDELPQLINVLCGDMSLVGPRPCLPSEFREYFHWHKRRFYTLPGITGLWQVNGKHDLTFKQMIRYDITYEQQRSFFLDLEIIIRTVPTVYMLTTDG